MDYKYDFYSTTTIEANVFFFKKNISLNYIAEFDEMIDENAPDFSDSGLKTTSVIRVGRLAVVEAHILKGSIGKISAERLKRIKTKLATWLTDS